MNSLKDYHIGIGRISWKLNIYDSKHIIHVIISTSGNGGHLELMFKYYIVSLHVIVVLLIPEYYNNRWKFDNDIIFVEFVTISGFAGHLESRISS